MSWVTCKESLGTILAWHVKSDTSRETAKSDKPKVLQAKSDKNTVSCQNWHFKSDFLRVTYQEWQLKSGKSRVVSQEWQDKSDKSGAKSQKCHVKLGTSRETFHESRMKSQKWQVKEWLPKSGMLKATSYDKFWPVQTSLLRLATWHLQILASKL